MGRGVGHEQATTAAPSRTERRTDTHTCYVCGAGFDLSGTVALGSAGPSDLCGTHYSEWFRAFNKAQQDGSADPYAKACEAVGYVVFSQRPEYLAAQAPAEGPPETRNSADTEDGGFGGYHYGRGTAEAQRGEWGRDWGTGGYL